MGSFNGAMDMGLVDKAVEALERANATLEPDLLDSASARRLLDRYARARRLAEFGIAALGRKLDDSATVARATGTSMGAAKQTVGTGKALQSSDALRDALKKGDVSLDQASEIARAEESAPGSARELLEVARTQTFHVLKNKARTVKLEADQHRDLAERQRHARCARTYTDEIGMVNIRLTLEPHIGAPIIARAEAEAARLARANKNGDDTFERHLADAYAALLDGKGKGRATRPELVVLVSHGVAARGWKDVREGEVCKIPGLGPIPAPTAKKIAADAFLSGVFYDGTDLRHFKRWSRGIPVPVAIALELGAPPTFDGVVCVDCGNRFRTEFDHVRPRSARGPTSTANLKPRCWSCHQAKTKRDRAAGLRQPVET